MLVQLLPHFIKKETKARVFNLSKFSQVSGRGRTQSQAVWFQSLNFFLGFQSYFINENRFVFPVRVKKNTKKHNNNNTKKSTFLS